MKFETMADLRFTGPQFLNAELENVLVYLPMDTWKYFLPETNLRKPFPPEIQCREAIEKI